MTPVGVADRAEEQAEVDLRRRQRAQRAQLRRSQLQDSGQRAEVLRREALGAGVRRAARARRAPRAAARASAARAPERAAASASEPASVLRLCAKAPATSARSAGDAASACGRRRISTSTESTFGTGLEDGARDRAQRRAPRSRAARAPTACRRRASRVPRRAARRPPAGSSRPTARPPGSCSIVRRSAPSRRSRREGSRRACRARARARRASSVIASPQCSETFAARADRVEQRLAQALVELHDVHVRGALGEVLGEHAQAAADLQHDVLAARAPPRARSRRGCSSRSGSSGRGRDRGAPRSGASAAGSAARAPRPPRSRVAGRQTTVHQPNRRAALRSTAAPSSRGSTPRSAAMNRSVCAT